MNIIAHTSTHLTLQDPRENIWIARLLSSIFLIWGGFDLIFAIIDPSFFDFIIAVHIVFLLSLGTATALFFRVNQVDVDKELGVLKITIESPLLAKKSEYSIDQIIDVIVEENSSSQGSNYAVFLLLASPTQKTPLSRLETNQLVKVEETANVIRTFLDIPL